MLMIQLPCNSGIRLGSMETDVSVQTTVQSLLKLATIRLPVVVHCLIAALDSLSKVRSMCLTLFAKDGTRCFKSCADASSSTPAPRHSTIPLSIRSTRSSSSCTSSISASLPHGLDTPPPSAPLPHLFFLAAGPTQFRSTIALQGRYSVQ